jgi:hypothetical protein
MAGAVQLRCPLGNHLRNARARGHDPYERAGTGYDYPAAPLRDGRRVTDELERVAQPLLGPQQDGAAVQW